MKNGSPTKFLSYWLGRSNKVKPNWLGSISWSTTESVFFCLLIVTDIKANLMNVAFEFDCISISLWAFYFSLSALWST